MKGTGWWKYEFCYGNKVQQYHEEKGVKKTVITLGKWDKTEHINWIDKNFSKKPKVGKTPKQVSHLYSNGDLCELTNKPRSVEVKLKSVFKLF
jgi:endoplasmic reticulum lectin 1